MHRPVPPAIRTLLAAFLPFLIGLATAHASLVFSEIHYHPVEEPAFDAFGTPLLDLSEDVHEYIELHNTGDTPTSLGGWRLAGGVDYLFPQEATIGPGGYRVVAKSPDRLALVTAYGLERSALLGPWNGRLSNQRDTVQLLDPEGRVVEELEYRSGFPWPTSANALGADEEWTGLKRRDFQYRGRSLERVSFHHPASDPANWLASPPLSGPTPGRPNTVQLDNPRPIVVALRVSQATDGNRLIRSNVPVRIECTFSDNTPIRSASVEWFLDNLIPTNRYPQTNRMQVSAGSYQLDLPGQTNRTLVRFRIHADRGTGDEVVSPRADDVAAWHAYFVTPVRPPSTNVIYDILISKESLRVLRTNIAFEPKRVLRPDPPGALRDSWNATQPAVFIHDGRVWDIQLRHHGSQYRREEGRRSYKLRFPDYDLFLGQDSLFVTDKDYQTESGHALYRAAGLPTSLTRWVDLYFNENAKILRLEQEEYNQQMMDRWTREQVRLGNTNEATAGGRFYKAQGVGGLPGEGPFGPANGMVLPPRTNPATQKVFWTTLQRYEQSYGLQNEAWRGHTDLQTLIDAMWAARPNHPSIKLTNGVAPESLRQWYQANWNIQHELTHVVFANWMGFWDDNGHNYFLWHQADGRWTQLPWDFDSTIDSKPWASGIYGPESGFMGNEFKLGAITTHWDEYRHRAWEMNNTLLHPEALVANGASPKILSWAWRHYTNANRDINLGTYPQPVRPTNLKPLPGAFAGPFSRLETSPFSHVTDATALHAGTLWEVRRSDSTYYEPAIRIRSTNALTRLELTPGYLEPGRTYFWRATHFDNDGHASVLSQETSFIYGVDDQVAGVVLSEVLADNTGSVRNGASAPDYVELSNQTNLEIDLSGHGLTDDLAVPAKFTFPVGTRIPASGRLIVWCDRRFQLPGLHAGFSLDAEGELLALFATGPDGPRLVDWVRFGLQLPDLSISRFNSPRPGWRLSLPTPAAENVEQPLGDPAGLRINEWMTAPSAGDDWVELFNTSAQPVALEDLSLTDDFHEPGKSPMPALSYIGGRSFALLAADGRTESGANHLSFRLARWGAGLGLFRRDGTSVDVVHYGRQVPDMSEGRRPDGTAAIQQLGLSATPGAPNSTSGDSDGDSFSDAAEWVAGTDPLDPRSFLAATASHTTNESGASSISISFLAQPHRAYRIEKSEAGAEVTWGLMESIPASEGAQRVERHFDATGPSQWFRVAVAQ